MVMLLQHIKNNFDISMGFVGKAHKAYSATTKKQSASRAI